jgi:hypothetical protein
VIKLAKLNTIIPDDLNKNVRDKVARVYGVRRGAMKDAVIEALTDWVRKKEDIKISEICKKCKWNIPECLDQGERYCSYTGVLLKNAGECKEFQKSEEKNI